LLVVDNQRDLSYTQDGNLTDPNSNLTSNPNLYTYMHDDN